MKPIPKLLMPVLPFDYSLLPPVFAEWVKDTAERKCWSPDYLAVAIVVVAGMLIGRKACVAPMGDADDWQEFPNSWGLFIGLPSAAKSPAISTVFSFIAPMVTAAEETYNLRKKEYDSEKEFHEAEIKALEAKRLSLLKGTEKIRPDKAAAREIHREIDILNDQFNLKVPKKKRYYTTDATAEKLIEIFYDNPQGVGFLADEFSRLLKQMLTDNFSTLRGTLLSSWNGKTPHTVDRISGDRDGKTSVLCTSVLGGIQPGMLQLLMGDNEEDGLAQRFGLMVWPDGVTATEDASRPPADGLSDKVEHVLYRLNAINMTDEPRIIPFDSVAAKAFNHWRCKMLNDIENGITDLAEGIFVSKYPKLLCALALIFAMCDGEVEVIPMSALERAMRWEPYLRSHLQRVINYASNRSDVHASNIISKLKRGSIGAKDDKSGYTYTSPRELQHKQMPGCDTAIKARELLDWLTELNRVQPGGKGSVKGVKEPYFVNPEIFEEK
jgi:putative DNA primase/helicase